MDNLPKIKILRNKGISEKVFINDHEIKGVTSIKISNSSAKDGEDITSVKIEIGFVKSLELIEFLSNGDLKIKAQSIVNAADQELIKIKKSDI